MIRQSWEFVNHVARYAFVYLRCSLRQNNSVSDSIGDTAHRHDQDARGVEALYIIGLAFRQLYES